MARENKTMMEEKTDNVERLEEILPAVLEEILPAVAGQEPRWPRDILQRRMERVDHQAVETNQHSVDQQAKVQQLLKAIEEADTEAARQEERLDQANTQRDNLESKLLHLNKEMGPLHNMIKTQESMLDNCSVQHNQHLEDVRMLKIDIGNLTRERDRHAQQAYDPDFLRSKLDRAETQLMQERLCSDTLKKRLHECGKDAIAELKTTLEINDKEAAKARQQQESQRARDVLQRKIEHVELQTKETQQHNDSQQVKQRELVKVIEQTNTEAAQQKRKLVQANVQRDILDSKLCRLMKEMRHLPDKIKTQQTTLDNCRVQRNQDLEEIGLLKSHICNLTREKDRLARQAYDPDTIRIKLDRTKKQLAQERQRCDFLKRQLHEPVRDVTRRPQRFEQEEMIPMQDQRKQKSTTKTAPSLLRPGLPSTNRGSGRNNLTKR